MFLKNRRAMMATVSAVFAMIFMLFFDSILTIYLISELKIGENSAGKINDIYNNTGYFFALICATYALSSPFVGILTAFAPLRWLTFISFIIASGALLMLGPS